MNTLEPVNSYARISVRITEQTPEQKTVTKRSTGSMKVLSFDKGEGSPEAISPFDTFVQILEGSAEIIIQGISHLLKTGQILILPAHQPNTIKANTGMKMIATEIK